MCSLAEPCINKHGQNIVILSRNLKDNTTKYKNKRITRIDKKN